MADWNWWAGSNDEYYHSACATREEAIACLEGEGGFICEAIIFPVRLSSFIDATDLIDHAEENSECGEHYGEIFSITPDQRNDLDQRLKAACDDWEQVHGLVFTPSLFSSVRNYEEVVADVSD